MCSRSARQVSWLVLYVRNATLRYIYLECIIKSTATHIITLISVLDTVYLMECCMLHFEKNYSIFNHFSIMKEQPVSLLKTLIINH